MNFSTLSLFYTQDIMKNSGEWHGYYLYAKTTGSKTFFTVDIQFTRGERDNGTFIASGRENGGEFVFRNAVIEGILMMI